MIHTATTEGTLAATHIYRVCPLTQELLNSFYKYFVESRKSVRVKAQALPELEFESLIYASWLCRRMLLPELQFLCLKQK